jgi:fructose-1,6-bisphosphatase II
MFSTHVHYMEKLVVGRRARGVIDIDMPVEWNLKRIAKAEGLHPRDLTVIILDRERNRSLIEQVREVGPRISLISGGDVAGAITAANEQITGKHVLMGSGGATEGVLAACAVKCLQGDMQAKLYFRSDAERESAKREGHPIGKVIPIDELCSGENIFFAATGITTGDLLKGVRYEDFYAYTHSMVLRLASGTMRYVDAWHEMSKLRAKGLLPEQVL